MRINIVPLISAILVAANPQEHTKSKKKRLTGNLAFLDPRNQPPTYTQSSYRGPDTNSRATYRRNMLGSKKRRKIG